MAVQVQLEGRVKAGTADDFITMMRAGLPETRAHDGCQKIEMYLNEDGQTVIFVETWDSKEKYEGYIAWRTETGAMDALNGMFEDGPNIRFFDHVKT
jgi:quinol monooxygenase YgiN